MAVGFLVTKPISEARFVLMPEFVVTDQGTRRYVDAAELMTAYGLSPYQIASTDQHKAIWLGPRQTGDYKEHLAVRLKARGYASALTEQVACNNCVGAGFIFTPLEDVSGFLGGVWVTQHKSKMNTCPCCKGTGKCAGTCPEERA